ncbi:MAG: hypothetical protein WB870_02855 [Gallionellaceae bacterium]
MSPPFCPGDRTYHVSDERLRAFRMLTPEQKLRWVEELATFLRLAKIGGGKPQETAKRG